MTTRPTVLIRGRPIGESHPVYVIAEVGVNHNGDVITAHRLIDAARAAGADAVKFQVFSADSLVAASAPACEYQRRHDSQAETQHAMLKRLELPPAAFRECAEHAAQVNLHFLATPFGIPQVRLLVELGASAVKIASPDLVNVPLLEAAAATGLPLIVSVGAAELSEIDQAVALLREHQADGRLIMLHCVSAYPTKPENANLRRIRVLAERFSVPVGFSDHTAESSFSGLAVAAGAAVLEKHLTLDRNAPGPDHFFSLSPDQFAEYLAAARAARRALGDDEVRVAPEEAEVRKLARGSIIAVVAIPCGQRVEPRHLSVRRPGSGIVPSRWYDVIGRKAKEDIPAGTMLTWSMLD